MSAIPNLNSPVWSSIPENAAEFIFYFIVRVSFKLSTPTYSKDDLII